MDKELRLDELEGEIEKIWKKMKIQFQDLIIKSMIKRDLQMDIVKDKLEESFKKLSETE